MIENTKIIEDERIHINEYSYFTIMKHRKHRRYYWLGIFQSVYAICTDKIIDQDNQDI